MFEFNCVKKAIMPPNIFILNHSNQVVSLVFASKMLSCS